ncbi:MAG: N-ethylammeline chlorohydrolase [Ilumatobacteraceae bacterium]|nr:N-ethylammeline chlorohydrolase [Ilumatobacteraceae bacterium]
MPELVLRGGTVITMGAAGTFVGDVGIDGGRIVALGADVGRGDVELDARGQVVAPGLVQAHVHLCQTLLRGLADDMDVIDWLRERIWPLERAHDAETMGASARLGAAELLLGGTTTALSMESVHHTDAAFEAVEALGLRAVIGKAIMDQWEPGTEMIGEETDAAWSDVLRLVERWHGAAGGRLQVAVSPRGTRNATVEMWRRCVALAAERDLRLHTHVDENRGQAARFAATAEGRDLVALDAWGALGPRMVMAHCVWLDDAERTLLRESGAHVCHCPSANLKLASGIAPIPEYLADGVNVALGADGAACNNRLDAFTEMRLAALIHKPRLGPRAMPARTVLAMATLGGARALGLADEIGSLDVGKRADVIAVRMDRPHAWPGTASDPADRLVYASQATDVDHVVVDGRLVVRSGVLQTADVATLQVDAERARRTLLGRVRLPPS